MAASWQLSSKMFLSVEESARLLQHVRSSPEITSKRRQIAVELDRLVIEGLLFSGLRTTEFCHLKVGDTIIGRGESVFVVSGLRGRDRTVYVPRDVSSLVERFVAQIRPALLPEGIDPADLSAHLIYGQRKNRMERTGLYRRVVRVLAAAGLGKQASVQLLRHTYGYLAYMRSGGNLLFVQRQLGHAHPMVTAIYAQFVEESYQSIAESVYDHERRAIRSGEQAD